MFVTSATAVEQAYWFIFYKRKLLSIFDNGRVTVPFIPDLSIFDLEPVEKQYLGVLDNCPCYAVEIPNEPSIPENMKFIG